MIFQLDYPVFLTLAVFIRSSTGHEYYDGSCPEFTSMEGFDWSRFTGDWWTILKMNTRSSCMRYSYGVDDGERKVTEFKMLPVIGRFGVPSVVESEATLTPWPMSGPGVMKADWNTGMGNLDDLVTSDIKYTILHTDYTSRALICSCQEVKLPFFAANRRSCEYLIRPDESTNIFSNSLPSDYKMMLDNVTTDLALDMRRVRQDDCDQMNTGHSFNMGLWWSLARDYGQTLSTMIANWF